ncbi:hypothetical protein OFEAOIEE_LOCUS3267 [Methylorubrum extorquens]
MPSEPTLWDLHHHTEADWRRILDSGPEQAASWIRFAAERGFRAAQLVLGQMHLDGHGVPRDPVAAYGWFERAAAIGSLDARNMLGRCHELGWGVPASHAEALHHYRRAAARGHAWGLYNLGCLLLYGNVRRNHEEAFRCFSAASEHAQGEASSKALGMLARCHDEGWGTPVDHLTALRCYQAATVSGDCWAALNLGLIYLETNCVGEAHAVFEVALARATPHCLPAIAGAIIRLTDPSLAELKTQAEELVQALGEKPRALSLSGCERNGSLHCGTAWTLNATIVVAHSLRLIAAILFKQTR